MANTPRLVVVSNRVPPMSSGRSVGRSRDVPVGGLVSAIRAVLKQREGIWFGWSGRIGRRTPSEAPMLAKDGEVDLATFHLTSREVGLFYDTFANRTLWPLLHGFPAKVVIRRDSFAMYEKVNQAYARVLISMLEETDEVWIQDYHLLLLGHELRALGWKGKLGFFLHVPFPPAEIFEVLPWARQLLESMLAYDLVGLHTGRYVQNLCDAMAGQLGGVLVGERFVMGGQSTLIKAYPIGIDPVAVAKMSTQALSSNAGRLLHRVRNRIILGVDRLDYTKGIPHRLIAFEHLLERFPAMRGKVSMIQISTPSRTKVPEYLQEREYVDRLVGAINGRFSEAGWAPIHYLYRSYMPEDLAAFYREARVCLVTPLRDGMNLVAKEFVASQGDDPGVLILSKFCGAAESMGEALIVNPYDTEETAKAIHLALGMTKQERYRRWESLIGDVLQNTAETWCDAFLSDLAVA